MARHKRFGSPLACLSFSLEGVVSGAEQREPTGVERETAIKHTAKLLRSELRDLDMVGSLGTLTDNRFQVVLPMTDAGGLAVVGQRLSKLLGAVPDRNEGSGAHARFLVSGVWLDGESIRDTASYVRALKRVHSETRQG